MESYNPTKIEKRWQEFWEKTKLNEVKEDKTKEKFYLLVMFPYPSGDLHVGHWYNFAPADAYARFKRMQGKNVLHPMGFDAFGLPAENAAIKHNLDPGKWTFENIERMRKQLKSLGGMYSWSREIITADPEYYKWTQWLFAKLFEKGLAYKAKALVNWCPSCQTVLANEQVIAGLCERCDTEVSKKELEQWFFKITAYAERLLEDLAKIDWPQNVKIMQENWIGKSEGTEINFKGTRIMKNRKISRKDFDIPVFTTRPDTIYGATYLVLSPEHPLVSELTMPEMEKEVLKYVEKTQKLSEIERASEEREKTGVFTGSTAINPATGEEIPIWIADYVLMSYGTGAIMAVPAHDQRDYEFAKKFGLPIKVVINPPTQKNRILTFNGAYEEPGILTNSEEFNGMSSEDAKVHITDFLISKNSARRVTQYRLRDWLISRQRYWGAPIPIIYCENCGTVPVPEKDLPVILPKVKKFKPTGESPLKYAKEFVDTKCPKCKGPAKRETDTMDTFVCSSWYYLRYVSPRYNKALFDPEKGKYWFPIDQYIGGAEHATLHLMYFRFFAKFLRDMKVINFDEPAEKLFNQGIILGPDGQKMSKSRGNVVDPDEYVKKYGADTVRAYLMFMGPYSEGGPWNPSSVSGVSRFLNRLWRFAEKIIEAEKEIDYKNTAVEEKEILLEKKASEFIKLITDHYENFRFNLVISSAMEFLNFLEDEAGKTEERNLRVFQEALATLVLLLSPATPFIAEELWEKLGNKESIFTESWPKYKKELLKKESVTLIVEVNGKFRDTIEVKAGISQKEAEKEASRSQKIHKYVHGRKLIKSFFVSDKLINLIVE